MHIAHDREASVTRKAFTITPTRTKWFFFKIESRIINISVYYIGTFFKL